MRGNFLTDVTISGIPAIAWAIGFVVLGALPVSFAAKITGAGYATIPRAAFALVLGASGSLVAFFVGGPVGVLVAPIAFLLAFKFVLDTSLLGAVILGVLALAGYFAMAELLGGGISFSSS